MNFIGSVFNFTSRKSKNIVLKPGPGEQLRVDNACIYASLYSNSKQIITEESPIDFDNYILENNMNYFGFDSEYKLIIITEPGIYLINYECNKKASIYINDEFESNSNTIIRKLNKGDDISLFSSNSISYAKLIVVKQGTFV